MLRATITVKGRTPVELAINAAGSASKLSRAIGVPRQTVHTWQLKGCFPDSRLRDVSKATGVPVKTLRKKEGRCG